MLSGKWHVAGNVPPHEMHLFDPTRAEPPVTPLQRGFDEFFGLLNGADSYFVPKMLMDGDEVVDVDADDFYLTDAITDRAVDMARRAAADEVPFFCYVAYTAPHWPLQALAEDRPLRDDLPIGLGRHPSRAARASSRRRAARSPVVDRPS